MHATIRRLPAALALLLALAPCGAAFAGEPAAEPKPVTLKTFPITERRLDKGVKGVKYSSKTYKFSRSTKVRLKEDQSLQLSAWSAEFRPTITVRASGSKRALRRGGYEAPKKFQGRDWYVTHLNFDPPDRGVFIVTISTEGIDKGTYFTEGRILGYEDRKPASSTPVAPPADASTRGFSYKPYNPIRGKVFHYLGGAYSKGGTFAAEVGVTWLEQGDTRKTLGHPTHATSKYGKVVRRDGDVFHFEPEAYGSGAKRKISAYKFMIFHPTKEIHIMIRVQAPHAASAPSFIEKGKALLAEHASKGRPKP